MGLWPVDIDKLAADAIDEVIAVPVPEVTEVQ